MISVGGGGLMPTFSFNFIDYEIRLVRYYAIRFTGISILLWMAF
jgi:hypothetical protein